MRVIFILMFFLSYSISSTAQQEAQSEVSITLTFKDADGKKRVEKKKLVGEEAENFDPDTYEKELAARDIEILTLDINKAVKRSTTKELHIKHDDDDMDGTSKKQSVRIKKIITKDENGNTKEIIEEVMGDDSDTFEIEEKDGKFYVNGEQVEGKKKQIRIMKSSDDEEMKEMKVEVKDGKVFINGEEVEETMTDDQNIWISDDDEIHKFNDGDHQMIFISDDMDQPKMGAMIEDGKEVNGAAIVEIVPDSPAAKAGLEKGDVVTAINNARVYGATSLMNELGSFEVGDEISVTYNRSGKEMMAMVRLEKMKGNMSKSIEKKIIIKTEEEKH